MSFDEAPSRARKIVKLGDILYSTVRPYLHNMCIINREFNLEPIASTGFAVLTCHSNYNNIFLFMYMMSPDFDKYVNSNENSKGVAYPAINDSKLSMALIPVPPLKEQMKIVEKIKKLEPLIENYKQTEEKLYELNSNIKEQLKKSILQYAIEGKLVSQNSNDEPASVLLEKIHEEKEKLIAEGKIKRDKNESIIYRRDNSYYEKQDKNETCIDEEIAFEIPERYVLVRLKTICSLYTGNSINQTDKTRLFTNQENGRNYIGTKDLDFNHCFDYNNGIKIPETYAQFKEAPKDSILLCIEGGSAGRKVGILNQTVCFGNKLCCFTPFLIEPRYIYYYLQSFQFISQFKDKMSGIIGGVSIKQIENILIPIPSINEQKLIIEKIEKVVKEA